MHFLLWHAVAESAIEYPERIAIEDGSVMTTYTELNETSNRFSHLLRGWEVGRGDHVALLLPKSAQTVAAMIGTNKAGAAYIPVDAGAPARRSAFVVNNSGARVLVTNRRNLAALANAGIDLPAVERVLLVDDAEKNAMPAVLRATAHGWSELDKMPALMPSSESVSDDPAYILYTSGSTGAPKGVVISHRNALTFVNWAVDAFHVSSEDRLSSHAPFHFDLSVFDLYAALSTGATVCLIPEMVAPFPMELARWIEESRISVWYSVPSALIRLLKQGQMERFDYAELRTVLFAGEVFPVGHLRGVMELMPHADFHNLYGPTETNVCTWMTVPRPIPESVSSLSIGRACANFDTFVATDDQRRAGPGEEGELLVRGPGVMLGYWGLPERTFESLGQNPLHADFVDPVYRTGDLVRIEDDGSYTFLGRRDHMVKTRGYRVELGDVETTIYQHAGVRRAVVVPVPDDDVGARLMAVVVPDQPDLSTDDLTSHCLNRLPHYAVPERFEFVQSLPETSSGKIDRQSLAGLFAPTPVT